MTDHDPSASRSSTPEAGDSENGVGQLHAPVVSFFSSVSRDGFPESENKLQPWKRQWTGPQGPSEDGKLIVACPTLVVYGMSILNFIKQFVTRCSLRGEFRIGHHRNVRYLSVTSDVCGELL
jgi:hypothetical protein